MLREMELAPMCRELALLLHAGVGEGDALSLLAQEDTPHEALLKKMAEAVDGGASLASSMEESGCFPAYAVSLLRVGQETGRTEEALNALAVYYQRRDRLNHRLRETLLYPAMLLVLMLVVVGVLLIRVLPVFQDVYASLGSRLTGLAGGLLVLGQTLDHMLPALCAILILLVLCLLLFSCVGGFRDRVLLSWQRLLGDRGVLRKLHDARFAQALSMGVGSGLTAEAALDLAAELLAEVPAARERAKTCRKKLEEGKDLPEAMKESGVLPASACRLLTLGFRSGSGDRVLEEVAEQLSVEADRALERQTARVEPALVLTASVLVGVILLAVMLPLLQIMQTIG